MKKQFTLIASVMFIAIIAMIFTGCGEKTKPEPTVKPSEIVNRLVEEVEIPMGMLITEENAADNKQMLDVMFAEGFDTASYDGFAFYPPMMNVSAQGYGVIKLKDEADLEKAKKSLDSYIKSVQATFEFYLQDQYEIAKGAEIKNTGKYVYFAMTSENAKVFKIIDEMLVVKE